MRLPRLCPLAQGTNNATGRAAHCSTGRRSHKPSSRGNDGPDARYCEQTKASEEPDHAACGGADSSPRCGSFGPVVYPVAITRSGGRPTSPPS